MLPDPTPTDFAGLYRLLADADIHFVLIGGGAANLLGSPRTTLDVDVVYQRSRENMERIVAALAPIHPYLRNAPPGLPFKLDFKTMQMGLNFTLVTDLGQLDLLGEVAGEGTYEKLLPHSHVTDALGVSVRCVNLDRLIALKRAAGRVKDFEPIAELEALRQEKDWEIEARRILEEQGPGAFLRGTPSDHGQFDPPPKGPAGGEDAEPK